MSKELTYAEKLQLPKWQEKRLRILKRDKFKCILCGDKDMQVQVHHLRYFKGEPWDTPNEFLITLCADCHKVTHHMWLHPEYRKQHKETILKVLKLPSDDNGWSRRLFAYTDKIVRCMIIMDDGTLTLIATLPIEAIPSIFKNIPKDKKNVKKAN